MKTYQFADRKIFCAEAGLWAEVGDKISGKAGTLIDLRTLSEIGDAPQPELPPDWSYLRQPLTGATISEQDMDVIRREFYRKPLTALVGPTIERASLIVTASITRREKSSWDYEEQGKTNCSEPELLQWLASYLERHGCNPKKT